MKAFQGDKSVMRSYMIQTWNEAVLHDEIPGRKLRMPLEVITVPPRKLKPEEYYFPPQSYEEEIIQFLDLNEDFCKVYGLGYPQILNLPWHRWIDLTQLVYHKKMRILERNRQEQRKADRTMRSLERRKG